MSGKREGDSQHMYGAQIQNDAKFTSVAAPGRSATSEYFPIDSAHILTINSKSLSLSLYPTCE